MDTLRQNSEDNSHNDVGNEFDKWFNELSSRYQIWPLSKKKFVTSFVTKLLNESNILFEPLILRPNDRPPKAKKEKKMNKFNRTHFKI